MTRLILDAVNVGLGAGARKIVLSSPVLRVAPDGRRVVTTSEVAVKLTDAPVSVEVVPGALRVQFGYLRGADRVDVVVPDVPEVALSELVATAQVATQPSAVEALLSALESRLDAAAPDGELVAQVAALADRVEALGEPDPTVVGRLAALEARVEGAPLEALDALEQRIQALEEAPGVDLAPLEGRVTSLENTPGVDLTPLEQRVQVLEETPGVDLTPLENRVEVLEQATPVSLEPLEGRLTTLEKLEETLGFERESVAEALGSFVPPAYLYEWGTAPGFPSKTSLYQYLALAVGSIAAPDSSKEFRIDIGAWMESTGYFKEVQNAFLVRKGLACALTIDSCVILAPPPEDGLISLNEKAALAAMGGENPPQELLDEDALLVSCISALTYTSPVPTHKAGMMVVSNFEAGGLGAGLRWWGYPTDGVTPVTVQETWTAWMPMPMIEVWPPESVTPLDSPLFTG